MKFTDKITVHMLNCFKNLVNILTLVLLAQNVVFIDFEEICLI